MSNLFWYLYFWCLYFWTHDWMHDEWHSTNSGPIIVTNYIWPYLTWFEVLKNQVQQKIQIITSKKSECDWLTYCIMKIGCLGIIIAFVCGLCICQLLGMRRLWEWRNGGYHTKLKAPLDDVPHGSKDGRLPIQETVGCHLPLLCFSTAYLKN
jgi:hypothetical protein